MLFVVPLPAAATSALFVAPLRPSDMFQRFEAGVCAASCATLAVVIGVVAELMRFERRPLFWLFVFILFVYCCCAAFAS